MEDELGAGIIIKKNNEKSEMSNSWILLKKKKLSYLLLGISVIIFKT